MEHEVNSDTSCNWSTWNDLRSLVKGREELEIVGRPEAIQATALLKSARILRRVLGTWSYLLSLRFQWKTISKCGWGKLAENNIINCDSPVGKANRIRQNSYLKRSKTPSTTTITTTISVLDIIRNRQMVRLYFGTFIVITPGSTLTRIGITCEDPT